METITKIPVGSCVENKFQPRSRMRGIEALARNMKVNGQLTPITVVADGETHQVVYGHRRLAAMKMNGEKWIDAIVKESWEDAVMARKLTAENCNREDLTAGEVGGSIQTMLQLGVPVTQVAASADMDVTKVRDFARGAQLVPDADGSCDFDAIVTVGEYRDVLDAAEVEAVMAAPDSWQRESICRRATGRANEARLAGQLRRQGVRVIGLGEVDGATMRSHDGEGDRAGLLAVVSSDYYGNASARFYRELTEAELAAEAAERARAEAERHGGAPDPGPQEPTPEQIAAEARFQARLATLRELDGHVTEFARGIYGKFPGGMGHSKLRAWVHEAFGAEYGEPDGAWRGAKRPKSGALDRFLLMYTVPRCLPDVPTALALRDGFEPDDYEADAIGEFLRFHGEVLAFARYRPTDEEAELFAHLRSLLRADEGEAEAEDASGAENGERDEPPAECPAVALAERILAEAEAEPDAEPELAMAA